MKQTLYLGLDPSNYRAKKAVTHFPIIEIVPRKNSCAAINAMFKELPGFTHIIFTSKTAVEIFFRYLKRRHLSKKVLEGKVFLAVGGVTASKLKERGVHVDYIAQDERQEGLISLLSKMDLSASNILLPRSAIARRDLTHFLVEKGVRHQVCILYDTFTRRPKLLPDLRQFDEIVFTSPSTVEAFFSVFRKFPSSAKAISIGPVTQCSLDLHLKQAL